jgi:hypothetical protein
MSEPPSGCTFGWVVGFGCRLILEGFFDLYTLVSDRSGMPGIYVERRVRERRDEVSHLMQTPDVDQRWDLRFTEIR